MPNNNIRTRFAPSPTGYMHVGNLRTALYTYLMAKHDDGTFMTALLRLYLDRDSMLREVFSICCRISWVCTKTEGRDKHVESIWLPCLDEGSTPSRSTEV